MLLEVLIVPLWNWNEIEIIDFAKVEKGFNRTFMELK